MKMEKGTKKTEKFLDEHNTVLAFDQKIIKATIEMSHHGACSQKKRSAFEAKQ